MSACARVTNSSAGLATKNARRESTSTALGPSAPVRASKVAHDDDDADDDEALDDAVHRPATAAIALPVTPKLCLVYLTNPFRPWCARSPTGPESQVRTARGLTSAARAGPRGGRDGEDDDGCGAHEKAEDSAGTEGLANIAAAHSAVAAGVR